MSIQHSYTGLSTFDQCPDQYRHLHILKDFKKTWQVETGIDAHKELEQRLRYRQELPQPLLHAEPMARSLESAGKVEVEVSFAVDRALNPARFWDGYLRGKYDVVLRWPEKRKAFIGDWKTGRVKENSDQLEIGALLLMANDPAIDEVTGANLWLSASKIGTPYTFTRQDKDTRWLKWVRRMQAIEALDPKQPWELRESALCGWCPVKSCVHYREPKK